jgi:hypothetical protein
MIDLVIMKIIIHYNMYDVNMAYAYVRGTMVSLSSSPDRRTCLLDKGHFIQFNTQLHICLI